MRLTTRRKQLVGKVKKLVCTLASAALAVTLMPAQALAQVQLESAEGFTVGGVHYVVTGESSVSVGYGSFDGNTFAVAADTQGVVNIPALVENQGKSYSVEAVCDNAFGSESSSCAAITNVALPASVKSIGRSAFRKCSALTSVSLPSAGELETIGAYAFANSGLTSLEIPGSVKTVDDGCFLNCLSLESVAMEEGASDRMLSIGSSAFAITESLTAQASLKSVSFPSNMGVVGEYAFAYQSKLADIKFAGTCRQLRSYAFSYCTSLKQVTIPPLTNGDQQMLEYVFRADTSLQTVIFEGNANVITGPFSVFDGDANVRYAVYRGYKWDQTKSSNAHEESDPDNFRSANPLIYYTVSFYSSKDAAVSHASASKLGSAAVRNDVPVGSIVAGMDTADSSGDPVVFEGSVPALPAGSRWAFIYDKEADNGTGEELDSLDTLPDSISAYPVNSYDLGNAQVIFRGEYGSNFSFHDRAIDFSFDVYAAGDSTPLTSGKDYSCFVTDSRGNTVDSESLIDCGNYTLTVSGLSPYTGTVSAAFSINKNGSTWLDITGSTDSKTGFLAAQAAYPSTDASKVVLSCDADPLSAIASFGLAAACGGDALVVEGDELSNGVSSTMQELRSFADLSSVYLAGTTLGKNSTVKGQLKKLATSPETSSLYNSRDASDAAAANALYTLCKKQGWYGDDAAIVISGANAVSVAPLAAALKAPVFVVGTDGTIPSGISGELSNFKNLIVVGCSASAVSSVRAVAGSGTVTQLATGQDIYSVSLAVANYGIEQGVLSRNNATVVSGKDLAGQLRGAMVASAKHSVLLVADEDAQEATTKILEADPWSYSDGFFVGSADCLTASLRESISDINNNLKTDIANVASLRLAADEFTYTSRPICPEVSLESTVEELVEDVDYTVVYENAKGPGTAKAWVRGIGSYRGLLSAEYTIAELPLSRGKITLGFSSRVWNGSVQKPGVQVWDANGTLLKKDSNYSVAYSGNCKDVGVYTVTVSGVNGYGGTLRASFSITPKAVSVKKLVAGKKRVTVRWTSSPTANAGYEIRYATKSSMAKAKTVSVKAKTTKRVLKKLKSKKKYFVQVRCVATAQGKTFRSAWSKALRVTVK